MTKKRQLKHQTYSLAVTENGYVISSPLPKGLVISGGGAKGLAYAGMFQAMEDRRIIKNLTHVGGASAGAMTSSFLAVGMSAENILKISTRLDITKLLDNKNMLSRAEGTRVRNLLELLYVFQIKQHMSLIEKPEPGEALTQYNIINQKIKAYERALKSQNIEISTIDDILVLASDTKSLKSLDEAFSYLPQTMNNAQDTSNKSSRITFNDLARLRNLLPEDQKHLIKHLSVVTTNQTKKKIQTYNEDLTGDSSIAEIVQQSGAHPILFKPVKNDEGHLIADGGIKNNMPTRALENAGLKPEEILCAKAESNSKLTERLKIVNNHALEIVGDLDSLIDAAIAEILGGRLFEGRAKVLNREKIFHQLGNMLYLDTGEITTITTAPTEEQRARAIETAYQRTIEFIDNRTKTFDNALLAMLYLGVDKLDHALLNTEQSSKLFNTAALTKRISLLQNAIVSELKKNQWNSAQEMIEQIEDAIRDESNLSEIQQNQALALCLKQINYFSEGALERSIIEQIKMEQGPEVSWLTHLLELLWTPIEWVLSLFSNTEAEQTNDNEYVNESPLYADEIKPVVTTALRTLSFLSYKEIKQPEPQNTQDNEQEKTFTSH